MKISLNFILIFDILYSYKINKGKTPVAKGNYIKLIFGLKLKQLRQEKNMSLSALATKSNLSISYLNEIESGKKYPKIDKIATLAESLGVTYDKLVSLKLMRNLAPIEELLESNILEQLPLDHYGIDIGKLIGVMSNTSLQLSALISTFIETAKGSEMIQNNFSRTALKTFKEFNDNYFEDLENAAKQFAKKNSLKGLPTIEYKQLKSILEKKYNYVIDESTLNNFSELSELRAVMVKGKKNKLFLNNKLSDQRKAFVVGEELAYNFLDIKDKSFIYSSSRVNSFDQLLNYFKAAYFSTALIINHEFFVLDINKFFNLSKWNEEKFLALIEKYNATPEMFFQRLTNLSAKYLGLNKFFFLRFNYYLGTDKYNLSKEVRLNTRRSPGGYQSSEHYCRRWVSIDTLNKLEKILKKKKTYNGKTAGILHSIFLDTNDEYLCISAAQPSSLINNNIYSVTIGYQVDDTLKQKINFWNDSSVPRKIVNDTCEKCTLTECKERIAPPVAAEKIETSLKIEEAICLLQKSVK